MKMLLIWIPHFESHCLGAVSQTQHCGHFMPHNSLLCGASLWIFKMLTSIPALDHWDASTKYFRHCQKSLKGHATMDWEYSIEIWWHYRLFGHCLSNNGNWFRFWSSFFEWRAEGNGYKSKCRGWYEMTGLVSIGQVLCSSAYCSGPQNVLSWVPPRPFPVVCRSKL